MYVEFFVDVVDVSVYCFEVDVECVGDFFVEIILGE